jgi:hypothetical protein
MSVAGGVCLIESAVGAPVGARYEALSLVKQGVEPLQPRGALPFASAALAVPAAARLLSAGRQWRATAAGATRTAVTCTTASASLAAASSSIATTSSCAFSSTSTRSRSAAVAARPAGAPGATRRARRLTTTLVWGPRRRPRHGSLRRRLLGLGERSREHQHVHGTSNERHEGSSAHQRLQVSSSPLERMNRESLQWPSQASK